MNPLAWIDCGQTVKSKDMIKWTESFYELSYRHYDEFEGVRKCADYFSFWSETNRGRIVEVLSA